MSKKEIVFVSNFLGNGGAARVITILADALTKKGYKVTICTFPFNDKEYTIKENVNYVKLSTKKKNKWLNKIERIWVLRKELKTHPNAVIISFEYFLNMQTIISCFGLKNRLIVSERNDPSIVGGRFPINIIRNILYRFCNVLVCQTPDAKEYFPKSIQHHTVVIPNPIKEDLPDAWTGEREHVVVNFCRLGKEKNLPLLIDAFDTFRKVHDDYQLYIYGDGKEKDAIEHYISERGLNQYVVLHEAVLDIHKRILKSAMFVSSSNFEGISNSMLEAMAIGIPTICTDCPCGGARMAIEHGINGLLTPVKDKESLVKQMIFIADNPDEAHRMSTNAQKVRQKFSSLQIMELWNQVICEDSE